MGTSRSSLLFSASPPRTKHLAKSGLLVGLVCLALWPTALAQETPLHKAAAAGDKELVARLLAEGADVNVKDKDGATALHQAAREGHMEIAELLLAKGAWVNAKDNGGKTPLGVAKSEEMKALLGRYGFAQFLARAQELHKAAAAGDKELVARLLDEGANVDAKDKDGHTPLHITATLGQKEVAEVLLAKGAWVDARGGGWVTPLHMAAQRNRKEVAELLLAKGADVKARTNATLQVPTHFIELSPGHSVPDRWLEVLEGLTPLHFAAFGGANDVTELLLTKGAEVNAKNGNGYTPLHMAARWNRKEVAELLLAKGADVNARTNFGVTPLRLAASEGHREVAELLRNHGAK